MESGVKKGRVTIAAVSIALAACASPASLPVAAQPDPSSVLPPLALSIAPSASVTSTSREKPRVDHSEPAPPTEPTNDPPPAPPSADTPQAEAAFKALDALITAEYDRSARHSYATVDGTIGIPELDPVTKQVVRQVDGRLKFKVRGTFAQNADETEKWDLRLGALIAKYRSLEWAAAAIERQGNIYDSLRMGLANAKPALFDAATLQRLASWRASGNPQLIELAQDTEATRVRFWEQWKKKELDGADLVIVRRYATVVAYARANRIRNERVTRALGRLAFYTNLLGDDAMDRIVTSTPDPNNRGATKLTYRKGQYVP